MINLLSGVKTRKYISHFLSISMVFVACFLFGSTRLYADPPGPGPYLSVEPLTQYVAASSGTTSFKVSTSASSWAYQVISGGDWLMTSKPDNWTISCSYKANFSTARTGTIRVTSSDTSISPQDVTVSQAGQTSPPVLSVSPGNNDVGKDAASTAFSVANTGTGSMSWTAQVTYGGWLTITSGASGNNSGTITRSFGANTDTSSRIGTIRVTAPGASGSPQDVTVTQAGQPQPAQPVLSVSPTTLTVGMDPNYSTSMTPNYARVLVSNTGTGALNWTAQVTSGGDWLQIRSGASGTNSGEVNVGFLSNTSVAARTGAIRITASGASGSPVDISVSQVGHLPLTILVPDTGQTLCYNVAGSVITCPSPGQALYGQDGNYSINPMSYTKLDAYGNDLPDSATTWYMVRDNVTRLIWEMKNNKDDKADYSNPHDADNEYTWYDSNPATNGGDAGTQSAGKDTESFLKALNDSNYGGYSDWRLPTIKELVSIVNHSISYPGPTINTTYFPNTAASWYWSSTTNANYTYGAWSVDFVYCYDDAGGKSVSNYVRAVRGGQSGPLGHLAIGSFDVVDSESMDNASIATGSYTDNGDGTVTDTSTGLRWQQAGSSNTQTWEQSLAYCEGLNLGGYTDWRLPTRKELQSLVDYSRYEPAINTTYFPNAAASWYWSSTTTAYYTDYAWGVDFYGGYGDSHYGYKYPAGYVRAVRGGQSGAFGDLIIGALAGLQQPSVPTHQPLELQVNSTNARRDTPVHQWLLYTTIINGAQSPLYLMSDRGTYELTNDVLTHLSNYTFTFDKDNVTPISSLTMSSMGLKAGDHFVYGYAYMNAVGTIFIDNVVSIDVK
jgi:hypothetical protein